MTALDGEEQTPYIVGRKANTFGIAIALNGNISKHSN
jgi:hypothetical protein